MCPNRALVNQSICAVYPMLEARSVAGWYFPASVVVWGHVTCSGQLIEQTCHVSLCCQ